MPVNLGWVSDGSIQTTVTNYVPRVGYVKFKSGDAEYIATVNQTDGCYCFAEGAISGTQTYYQWGRKDPFVSDKFTTATGGSVENGYKNPNVFYTSEYDSNQNSGWWISNMTSHSADMWCSTAPYNGTHSVDVTAKTIFDPCPVGFAVAPATAFNDFQSGSYTWNNGYTIEVAGRNIYFPASGMFDASTAALGNTENGYGLCSTISMSNGMAHGFYFTENDGYPDVANASLGGALPVRPVLVVEPSSDDGYEEDEE